MMFTFFSDILNLLSKEESKLFNSSINIVKRTIRKRPNNSHKGTFGKVCIIGGNQNFGGAAIMASKACVYSGAGLTTTFTDPVNLDSFHNIIPEAMFVDYHDDNKLKSMINGFDVILIGPGLGTDDYSLSLVKQVFQQINNHQILIIDGSAITIVANHHLTLPDANIIFTPHQMEWQRLSDIAIPDQNDKNNQNKVNALHSTVVLKSHHTKVYSNNHIWVNPGGTPAQATGGMGDTLAGMIAGFTAQFANTEDAVISAVFAHSFIADKLAKNQYVVLPTQISDHIPQFMKKFEN